MAKKRPQQRQPKQPSKRAQREAAAARATFADDDESISSASEDDELQQPPATDEREETVEEARLRPMAVPRGRGKNGCVIVIGSIDAPLPQKSLHSGNKSCVTRSKE